MKCVYCGKTVLGEAVVVGANFLVHSKCKDGWSRKQRGLIYDCPKCKTTGLMNHPSGEEEYVEVPLDGEPPDCAADGCMGCRYCRNLIRKERRVIEVMCNLCDGEGYLKRKPEPVTSIVDWKVPEE